MHIFKHVLSAELGRKPETKFNSWWRASASPASTLFVLPLLFTLLWSTRQSAMGMCITGTAIPSVDLDREACWSTSVADKTEWEKSQKYTRFPRWWSSTSHNTIMSKLQFLTPERYLGLCFFTQLWDGHVNQTAPFYPHKHIECAVCKAPHIPWAHREGGGVVSHHRALAQKAWKVGPREQYLHRSTSS